MIRYALAFALSASAADAQAVKLRGDEITILLSGNTAIGSWDGQKYRQYFDPDGTTIYALQGSRSARGKWRVEGEEYQSIWPADAGWEGWYVMEYDGQWFWVSRATPPTPFDIVQGQKLVAQ